MSLSTPRILSNAQKTNVKLLWLLFIENSYLLLFLYLAEEKVFYKIILNSWMECIYCFILAQLNSLFVVLGSSEKS